MLDKYIISLDNITLKQIDNEVSEKGIENYLNQKLYYLDATRVTKNGLRVEQTINHVYKYDITQYLYAVNNYLNKNEQKVWIDKLKELHNKNIEYEKINPPIIYDKKKRGTSKRKTKKKEEIIEGFEVPKKKQSKAEAKLAKIKALNISLNLIKPK